jgi:hypothetical protein
MKFLQARSKPWGRWAAIASVILIVSSSCSKSDSPPKAPEFPFRFRDMTADTGVNFVHTDGSGGQRFIVESMSAGIATFDYDQDGLIDIYFPNGAPLPGTRDSETCGHALYRNLGNWQFLDVTAAAGVASRQFGLGVTAGDINGDGFPDLYVNNFGPSVLYLNNGDGTFTDITDRAGIARGEYVAAGTCFLDAEGDGLLDLYVGNYIDLDLDSHIPNVVDGFHTYPSPKAYHPVPDMLYQNCGDGTFLDVSQKSGIGHHAGRSMGMVCADANGDGATDVFVLNDVQNNFFFCNDGKGHYDEIGLLAGVAVNREGEILANMGADCADYDNDGNLDFFTTNYQSQWPMLLHNLGDGIFEDVATLANAGAACVPYVNWGCGFADFENDGHRDIFVGNGHTEDNVEERDGSTRYRCTNVVLQNTGTGKFADISESCGVSNFPPRAARGVAFDDLDNDGDIDVIILNSRQRPSFLRNLYYENGGTNRWLQLRLHGGPSNRTGVGARVQVTAGGVTWTDEVHSGRGYQGHWGIRLHFGLGTHDRADRIEVRWVGGGTDVLKNVAADQLVEIVQGESNAP